MSGPAFRAGDLARLASHLNAVDSVDLEKALRLRGVVAKVSDGVAQVVGLSGVGSEELVAFDSGALGMAYDIEPESTGVILLSSAERVGVGEGVVAVGTLPMVTVGPELIGRLVDPFGRALDDLPDPPGETRPMLCDAPRLTARCSVDRPLHTGVLAMDAAIPIGCGQRQLILGDRNVGKSALALDIVVAQRGTGVVCVYVAIGQPLSRVLAIQAALREADALSYSVVVAAEAADAPGMQYLAPYAGMAIAERFREEGRDTLIILDDLTKHADAYRELALLLGRPPGREAFPGDIFYIHGELLERASAFSAAAGGGSITAFPIVETTDSDLSAYIPTNLISITDGQVYLDTTRFERNQRPAIDIGRSVSRIGGAAQHAAMRAVAKNLRIEVARFEALEALTRVGLDIDPKTTSALERGRTLRALMTQPRFTLRTASHEVLALTAVAKGWVHGLAPERMAEWIWAGVRRIENEAPDIIRSLEDGTPLGDEDTERARKTVAAVGEQLLGRPA